MKNEKLNLQYVNKVITGTIKLIGLMLKKIDNLSDDGYLKYNSIICEIPFLGYFSAERVAKNIQH